jgi:hypothetical protein
MKCEREFIRGFKSDYEFWNDIGKEYLVVNEIDMISNLNDFCLDHLPNRDEKIDMDYHL